MFNSGAGKENLLNTVKALSNSWDWSLSDIKEFTEEALGRAIKKQSNENPTDIMK